MEKTQPELEVTTVPKELYYHEVAYVRGLEAENTQLRTLLVEFLRTVKEVEMTLAKALDRDKK